VATDASDTLERFRDKHQLPFTLLSDPELRCADALEVPTSARHPMALTYPKRAFLQPALFVWLRSGELAYAWRQTPRLKNLFGAAGRPSGEDVRRITAEALGAS